MSYDHTGILIKIASLTFNQTAAKLLSDYHLTPSQFKILKYLSINKDKVIRQIDIEQFFKMSNPTVTGILQNLEKKEMIERKHHPNDRRAKIVVLSEKSALTEEDYLKISQTIEDHFTEGLDEDDINQLKSLLLKLINNNSSEYPIKKKGNHGNK